MNKQRRKELDTIYRKIEELMQDLTTVCGDEQDAYDNLPESFQESERGETMYNAIDNMESALSSLSDALDYIVEAV